MVSVVSFLCLFAVALCGVPLTINVPASSKKCYYVRAHREQAKIRASFTVLTGGHFDIDATLSRQGASVIESAFKTESEDWLLHAPVIGEYELCFFNERASYADKSVEFEFSIDTNTIEAQHPDPANTEHTVELERYIREIDMGASEITSKIAHLRGRNTRNEFTVRSTFSRIWWFTVFELIAIVGMAIFNVSIVQIFFKGARKNIV